MRMEIDYTTNANGLAMTRVLTQFDNVEFGGMLMNWEAG